MTANSGETVTKSTPKDATKARECILDEFKHVEEVRNIIASIPDVANSESLTEMTSEKMTYIVDLYQEQPHLLDPHLESLLGELLSYVRDPKSADTVIHLAFKYLYLIAKTRGPKVMLRLMPHEVADLEPVLALLARQGKDQHMTWETRYMLLLWLSIVSMIPFDMARLDSNIASDGDGSRKLPIMERIMQAGQEYVVVSDISRNAAAYMLSRFMTRPDVCKQKLPEFLDWSLQVIHKTDTSTVAGMSVVSGVLTTLSLLFKHGKREDLVSYAPTVLQVVLKLKLNKSMNTVLNKLGIKLIQRIGLTFLKARVAAWRYQRGNRSLADTLAAPKPADSVSQSEAVGQPDEDEDYDISEEIEEVLEQLLNGLRDANTVVRWSAAKGIGRVTGRLPQELADEVVGSLMELFTITETDAAWHGGCLALAELGRRGLLLPERLDAVVPVIIRALSYDEKRGNFSVGAHVRDAACYVCWAFARAYDPQHLGPYVNSIASALVIAFIFDREVNVRRAAAAAFQENVGRQGNFPHGIDILTSCDYFAVGNRTNCYLQLSVFVAQFPQYTRPLIDHLVDRKTNHWDIQMRELAGQSLHNLTARAPAYMAETVLHDVVELCSSIDVNQRHGAILAAGHITAGLAQQVCDGKTIQEVIGDSTSKGLQEIVIKLQDAKLFRGVGGELMRKAVCCFIENVSLSKLTCESSVIDLWQGVINDCLQHVDPDIQAVAVSAIPSFVSNYYKANDGSPLPGIQDKIITQFISELSSSVETTRMGYALALGALPSFFLQGRLGTVLTALIEATRLTKQEKWAEARRDAIKAVTNVCSTVGVVKGSGGPDVIHAGNIACLFDMYFAAMKDYTLDSRGDVGAWVREAAMTGLETLTILAVNANPDIIPPDIYRQEFCHLVQQAVEKIDRTRAHAGTIFYNLLHHVPQLPHIPHREEVIELFPKSDIENLDFSSSAVTFPRFSRLSALPTYTYSVLLGLTVSVGGLTESVVRYSADSLMFHMRSLHQDPAGLLKLSNTMLTIFRDYQHVDRVSIPMLKMMDQLLSRDLFRPLTEGSSCSFGSDLIQVCKKEIASCGNPQKLLASIDVFCGLLQFAPVVQKQSLSQLCRLLCQKYPIVRKTAGTALYEAIITYEDVVHEENLDDVMTLLSDTLWDQPVDTVRPIRNQLCVLLKVPTPVIKSKQAAA